MHFARVLSWIIAVPIWIFTFLLSLTAYNAYDRYASRGQYVKAEFVITDATYYIHHSDDGPDISKWLDGEINGQNERYIPNGLSQFDSRDEILNHFKIGTRMPVLYNADKTSMIRQGETIRVIPGDTDFDKDFNIFIKYITYFLMPSVLFCFILYFTKSPNKSLHGNAPP